LEDLVTALLFLQRARESPRVAGPAGDILLVGTGGDGVLGSDLLSSYAVSVPDLGVAAREALEVLAAPGIGRANPVDLASLGSVLNFRTGDTVLDDVVEAILDHQSFTDVVLQIGVTSLFLYFSKPAELLSRVVVAAARLPARHPAIRFTVVVQASGACRAEGQLAARGLAEAGCTVVDSMRDAAVGLRALGGHR
jgi:hypothetical protein